jgi:hypothetical protein
MNIETADNCAWLCTAIVVGSRTKRLLFEYKTTDASFLRKPLAPVNQLNQVLIFTITMFAINNRTCLPCTYWNCFLCLFSISLFFFFYFIINSPLQLTIYVWVRVCMCVGVYMWVRTLRTIDYTNVVFYNALSSRLVECKYIPAKFV